MGFDPRAGNSTVEAAMIWPLIILIMAAMISKGFDMYSEVEASAAADKAWAEEKLGNCGCEAIMRTEWFLDYE